MFVLLAFGFLHMLYFIQVVYFEIDKKIIPPKRYRYKKKKPNDDLNNALHNTLSNICIPWQSGSAGVQFPALHK